MVGVQKREKEICVSVALGFGRWVINHAFGRSNVLAKKIPGTKKGGGRLTVVFVEHKTKFPNTQMRKKRTLPTKREEGLND